MTLTPAEDFLRSTRTASEFSALTGISQDTLREWRKRGISTFLGEQLPSGYWGYSMKDAMAVHLASGLRSSGFEWKEALWIGFVIAGYLTSRFMYPDWRLEKHRYIVFSRNPGGEKPEHRTGDEIEELLGEMFNSFGAPVVHVADVVWAYIHLPKEYSKALAEIERAAKAEA